MLEEVTLAGLHVLYSTADGLPTRSSTSPVSNSCSVTEEWGLR
jgi:hypothetical protein